MIFRFIGIVLFLMAHNILAYDNIIPKLTNSCPNGYKTSSNNYCIPINNFKSKLVTPKVTNTCPFGFHTSGSSGYCIINNNSVSMPIIKLNNCPPGYHTDGSSGYCKKN